VTDIVCSLEYDVFMVLFLSIEAPPLAYLNRIRWSTGGQQV